MEEALSVRTVGVLQISNFEAPYLNVSVDQFQRMTWNLPSITTRRKVERNELMQTHISGDLNPPAHWIFGRARGMETRLTIRGASLSEMQRVVCLRSPALTFMCPASDLQYTTSQFDSHKFKVFSKCYGGGCNVGYPYVATNWCILSLSTTVKNVLHAYSYNKTN